MKTKHSGGASVRDLKAAALDQHVKIELEKTRSAQASKMSSLRALRLARAAEDLVPAASIPPKAARASVRRRTTP
jgi:hypothetical protein